MSGESAYRTVAWAGPPPNIPACKAHNASRTLQVHVPPTTPQSWEENVAHGVDRDAGDCPCGGGRPAASVLWRSYLKIGGDFDYVEVSIKTS